MKDRWWSGLGDEAAWEGGAVQDTVFAEELESKEDSGHGVLAADLGVQISKQCRLLALHCPSLDNP